VRKPHPAGNAHDNGERSSNFNAGSIPARSKPSMRWYGRGCRSAGANRGGVRLRHVACTTGRRHARAARSNPGVRQDPSGESRDGNTNTCSKRCSSVSMRTRRRCACAARQSASSFRLRVVHGQRDCFLTLRHVPPREVCGYDERLRVFAIEALEPRLDACNFTGPSNGCARR
jgi:hypothetical protein